MNNEIIEKAKSNMAKSIDVYQSSFDPNGWGNHPRTTRFDDHSL